MKIESEINDIKNKQVMVTTKSEPTKSNCIGTLEL